jgi:cytochrome c oxidase cbb3-type subunit III
MGDQAGVVRDVRRALSEVAPDQAIAEIRTVDDASGEQLQWPKYYATLLGIFAGVATMGILVSPVIRNGGPERGMPKLNLTEEQISDVVAWLHGQTYAADHINTHVFLDVVTGDPKQGEVYFNGAGGCAGCHSPTGDLKGIASKYDNPHELQGLWLQPRRFGRGGRGGGRPGASSGGSSGAITVTVTLPSGQTFSGTLDRIDDFNVSMHDSAGEFHSFDRDGATPKVEIHDLLKAHLDLLRKYTDADIHNVTAYLVTLK